MLNPDKDQPTHPAWSQRRERGKFREWYKRGHAWIETNPQGQTIFCIYEGIPGPRGYDGFIYAFPNGVVPTEPPAQAQRPGTPLAVDDEDV